MEAVRGGREEMHSSRCREQALGYIGKAFSGETPSPGEVP